MAKTQPLKAPSGAPSTVKPIKIKPTVLSPERIAFPGIYDNPLKIAAEAASRVAPESPNLKRLFGVTRADLQDIANSREGNLPGALPGAAENPKGSAAAEKIMTPKNVQRILDVNAEATKFPELVRGMDPWYVMDPFFKRMAELMGKEKAVEEYTRMNILSGMASPGSEVMTEIPRGSAAYFLNKQGRWNEFMDSMAIPQKGRKAAGVAEDIIGVPGHIYHRSAQAEPMEKYLKSGEFTMTTPKVPLYIESSGVPETGFQTRTPVGDAHWSRAVGLGDTRTAKKFDGSVSNPEMTQLAPWWREKIAKQLGIESVPAQARTWGAFSGQTGVTTPIGSPKLEMIADQIMDTARRLGVSPETARDMVMMGEARIGKAEGGMVESPPQQAIADTVRNPNAARMLEMDLANLAVMNQQPPQRMAGGGLPKMLRIMHGSPTKIKPTNERPLHVTTDPLYATKRGSDKLDQMGMEGPPMVNRYDIPEDKLLRMDETMYSPETINLMRRYWNRIPADTAMTGEEIYDLLSANKQPFDRLLPGISQAGGFLGYQRPATGTGGRDEWFKIMRPESLEVVKKKGGAVKRPSPEEMRIELMERGYGKR
jgi:hypothetical protein